MASIYEIDQQIMQCIDFETGEIVDAEKLNALQIEKDKKIEGIACWIKNLNAEAQNIKAEEQALAERRKAKENKAEQLKQYLSDILEAMPFESARAKITFRKSTAVNITDESKLADGFKKVETVVKIDKKAIGDALKFGEIAQGEKNIKRQIAILFEKYLDVTIKGSSNKIKERKLAEFQEFLKGVENGQEEV